MIDRAEAKARIVSWALGLGISKIGIAPGGEPVPGAERLVEWLAGRNASMGYLARDPEGRSDPRRVLDGCESVICCALDYEDQLPDPASGNPRLGRIARYAWGDDYHDVLGAKLEDLAGRIREAWPGEETRVAVDSSPVLEKAFAARAGLGWIGRHSCVIDRERGSFFVLGEIFTTLPLVPDEPVRNLCGACMRCVDACPGGAIVETGTIDADRCISYLTVEHRGAIDPSRNAAMGNWIFGCDVCQDVCPWNRRKVASTADPRFAPDRSRIGRPLEELSAIEAGQFRERFRGTSILRARHDGWIRNVTIAMRNAWEGA